MTHKKPSTMTTCAHTNERIRPWDANPRYWQYKGKPVLLLGGTCEDNLFQIPDMEAHLDLLVSVGGNYIRNTMSDRDAGNVYPYKRLANGRYDLNQWCDEYWERFAAMVRLTHERDIIVQLEVWDRFDLTDAKGLGNWQRHPYRPANNINYEEREIGLADAYPDHPSKDKHPFYHTIPGMQGYQPRLDRLREIQKRFVAKMLLHSLPYGNILYCMNNETNTEVAWGQYWMTFIKRQAKQANVNVCVTDMFDDVWKPEGSSNLKVILENPQLYDYLDVSQVNSRNFGKAHWDRLLWIVEHVQDHPRPVNHTKIYSDGNTSFGSGTPQDGIERFWRNLLCGSASSRFHRPSAGIGLNKTAQACIRAAREVERLVRLWNLQPHMELLSERGENDAYLAASPGEAYVIFFPRGGAVRLDITEAAHPLVLRWIDIACGNLIKGQKMVAGAREIIEAPTISPWVAVLTRKGEHKHGEDQL